MIRDELLRYARIYGDQLDGLSLDFRLEDRRLSIEGNLDDLWVYPSDDKAVYAGKQLARGDIAAWFRWLAGLGETP